MSAQIVIIPFVEADQLPNLDFTFSDEVTGPIDLNLFDSIVVRVRKQDGQLLLPTVVIDDAINGIFHAEWGIGELTAGSHEAEVVFTDLDLKPETFPVEHPLILRIREKV